MEKLAKDGFLPQSHQQEVGTSLSRTLCAGLNIKARRQLLRLERPHERQRLTAAGYGRSYVCNGDFEELAEEIVVSLLARQATRN